MTTTAPAWYTSQELTPTGECRGGGDHEWVPEGNCTYLRCHKGNESADIHLVDDDGLCLNCGVVHWRPEAIVVHHELDEMDERFQEGLHQLAVRCGNCGNSQPITIRVCAMPDEAGR